MYFLGTNTNFYIRFIDCAILGIGFFLFSWIVTLILGLIFESPIIVSFNRMDGAKINMIKLYTKVEGTETSSAH